MSIDPSERAAAIPADAAQAAFPLGGIGTGNVSIGARGELRDWELENLPDKGRLNPFTFFAISAQPSGGERVSRVLEARLRGRHEYDSGYGWERVGGLPRLAESVLRGEYPTVRVDFQDDLLPVQVALEAFTPLVPLDADASGIPAAVLRYRVTNPGSQPVDVTVAGSMTHLAGRRTDGGPGLRARQTVAWRESDGLRGLDFGIELPSDDFGYGTLSLATTDPSTTAKPCWVVSPWPDGTQIFWDDLTADGRLDVEQEPISTEQLDLFALDEESAGDDRLPRHRTGSLGIVHEIAPGETRDFEFLLAWSFPNRHRSWFSGNIGFDSPNEDQVVLNHYATRFADAWAAAEHLADRLPELESTTREFVETLYGGSLDPVVADAAGATLATLRSTTCFRIGEQGDFLAWEGSFDHSGSCAGTCTHVWSYAQSVAWLFPELERSARRIEFLRETDAYGVQKFRTATIFGGKPWSMGPAVDGQLGTFLRLHREWRFSGDDGFLREVWPAAARTLEHALQHWDRDGDGLLDGKLHNTYDIEFWGVEPLANGFLLAALRAGARMAEHLGEADRAERWRTAAERGSAAMDARLWTGEYYRQEIADVDEHRYQYGNGVLSDQLLGQFHAHLGGLGWILPEEHAKQSAASVFRYNHRADLSLHESTQRTYALNDEGGLLLASWPHGGRPRIPFIYSDEVWTGIEYQVATQLVYAGLVDEALTVVRALRARHTGWARSPWNEIECGNHYARSMASWGVLVALTGVQYDAPRRSLAFTPAVDGALRAIFTTGSGWGRVSIDGEDIALEVLGGTLDVDEVLLRGTVVGSARAGANEVVRLSTPETARPVTSGAR